MLTAGLARQCHYETFFGGGGGEQVLYGQLTRLSLAFAERVWLRETNNGRPQNPTCDSIQLVAHDVQVSS